MLRRLTHFSLSSSPRTVVSSVTVKLLDASLAAWEGERNLATRYKPSNENERCCHTIVSHPSSDQMRSERGTATGFGQLETTFKLFCVKFLVRYCVGLRFEVIRPRDVFKNVDSKLPSRNLASRFRKRSQTRSPEHAKELMIADAPGIRVRA